MTTLKFIVAKRGTWPSKKSGTFTLLIDEWDDFHFKTSFVLHYANGDDVIEIGAVKIATVGMAEYDSHTELPPSFPSLGAKFYSLGQDREYYEALTRLPGTIGREALVALRDIAASPGLFAAVHDEPALSTSLLRRVPEQTVTNQFRRIADGQAPLTPYRFSYLRAFPTPHIPNLRLEFSVHPGLMPPTNMHVVIGPNGVGKSQLLRDFTLAASDNAEAAGVFRNEINTSPGSTNWPVFANVVHVAYSAFDRASISSSDEKQSVKVHPVGLSELGSHAGSLDEQFRESLGVCAKGPRRSRWLTAIQTLEAADPLLADLDLGQFLEVYDSFEGQNIGDVFSKMSSGHKIVVLTMSRLVELVEEQSLVLIDEPETHLHPPLLSALIRAVSDLMIDRNGVAIVATHSPVVLQEVPRSCVWTLRRSGNDLRTSQLNTESFGESVSRLSSEVFHLDVTRTGYHQVLRGLLASHNGSADQVLTEIDNQLGSEGRFVLRALEHHQDK